MPGRIVGRTEDRAGNNGYVLTLQTREQHIKRAKATSNICSNQALMALANAVYLSLTGETGFRNIAEQCWHKAHYLHGKLLEIDGVTEVFETPFFREFALQLPVPPKGRTAPWPKLATLPGFPSPASGQVPCSSP